MSKDEDFEFWESEKGAFNCSIKRARHLPTGKVAETWGNAPDAFDLLKRKILTEIDEEKLELLPRDRIYAEVSFFNDEGRLIAGHSVKFGESIVVDNMRVSVGLHIYGFDL